jgi:O-antigen/teichoic acid export membrane protein
MSDQRLLLRFRGLSSLYLNGTALTGSSALTAGLGFVFWVVIARRTDQATVGSAGVVISALTGLSAIAQVGLGGVLVTYLPTAGPRSRGLILLAYGGAVAAALLLAAGFMLAMPLFFPSVTFLHGRAASLFFVLSVVVWSIFALQDSILTGLRQAVYIPVENAVYGVAKLAVVALAGSLTVWSILLSWVVPAAILTVPVTILLFHRLLPRHTAIPVKVRPLDGWRAYLARDTVGLLCAQGLTVALPVVVLSRLGAESAGAFAVVWMLSQTLDLLSINMGMSLTVEGVHDQDRLPAMLRQLRLRIVPLVCLVAAIGAVTAPFVLTLFGPGYAASGATALAMLLLGSALKSFSILSTYAARARRDSKLILYVQVIQTSVTLIGTLFLSEWLGLTGVGVAYVLAQICAAVFLLNRRSGQSMWVR